jgi:glucuronoarabinoxylan endo-1,4-beta-xylanase
MPQPYRDSLYDTVFVKLGLDIYRVRNTYDYDSGYLDRSAAIIAAAKERNPSLKILISAWSPAAYLKSNGKVEGGGNATLAKDPTDSNNSPPNYYVYKKYAEWWYDSLVAWSNKGVVADYVCIQNEPDVDVSYDSCRFDPTENDSVAGYNQAFEKVYQELYSRMGPNMPKMLPPETGGFYNLNTYIDNLIDRDHAYGFAHHLYNGGGAYNYPDGFIPLMTYYSDNYGDKPLMMTEFSKLGNYEDGDVTTYPEAMNLAGMMHNSLVFENVSAYVYWELFWTSPKGLISYENTYPNPVYYALKHYSAFTDPGWYRVEASTDWGDTGNVRISAFKSPDNQHLSIVIINFAYYNINLTLNLNGFPLDNAEIYRTSETENTAYIGPFYEAGSLMLPARSITTISNVALSNCDSVLVADHGLTSDIYPDCYVNYEDLKTIIGYWLNTECDLYGGCEGADFEPTDGNVDFFDFARFAEQWLLCNDPEDAGCIENW